MQRILMIGAHFDDVDLGAGGTAAKFSREGKQVYKLTLTDNVTKSDIMGINVDYESSKIQSARACEVMGINEIDDFIPQPCTELVYTKEIMQTIEKYIIELKIDTVLIHFNADMNTDHLSASRICLTASRHVDNIFQFQSNGYVLENVFYPTFFVDISDVIDVKKKALGCYSAEHNRFNRLFDTCIERNHVWGYSNGVEYVEGFNVIKMLYK